MLLRALSGVVASVAALLIWLVAVPILDVKLDFADMTGATQTVVPAAIILFSIVPALAGWALLALLERVTPRRALPIWTTVAVLALLLSFVPLFGVSAGAAVALGLMHLAVGAVIIAIMRRTAKPAPAATPAIVNG